MDKAFDYLFQAALALGGLVLGWLHLHRNAEVAEMKTAIKEAAATADEAGQSAVAVAFEAGSALAAHKLYAAENFARKGDVERAIDKAERRLADQMAENQKAQLQRLEEIRDRLPRT